MVPRLQWRRIGNVNIFELQGVFIEPWLNQNKEEMAGLFEEHPASGLLINLREVERIDHQGVETILRTARLSDKGGILGQNISSYFVAENMDPNEAIPIFEKESDAITYFQREFAEPDETAGKEKRRFQRINAAIPVEFELREENQTFRFEAVVLNLSEGGFFGRFLDSRTEEVAGRVLDPYDLKMLKIHLGLGEGKGLKMEGKILRTDKEAVEPSGVAVEFYHLRADDREKIREFLVSKGVK